MRSFATLLLMLLVAMPCCAADPAPPSPGKTQAPRDTYPLYGKVASIDSQMLVIKGGKGKPDRKFSLTKDTLISKDAKPASLAQVVPGQWVGGLVRRTASGPHLLQKLNLSVKQKP